MSVKSFSDSGELLSEQSGALREPGSLSGGGGGASAKGSPISTREDLEAIEGESGHYYLTNDIDLAGDAWVPITFSGVLDGNGYVIRNMTVTPTSAGGGSGGLFSNLTGVVFHLGLEDVDVDVGDAGQYKAAFAGNCNDGGLFHCYVEGGTIQTSGDRCGGLVGFMNDQGSVYECYAAVSRDGSTGTRVGGLVGYLTEDAVIRSYFDKSAGKWNSSSPEGSSGPGDCLPPLENDKTTAEMQTASEYRGWNFAGFWTTDGDTDYPRFQ